MVRDNFQSCGEIESTREFEFYAVHEADEKCLTVKILNDTIFSINPMRE